MMAKWFEGIVGMWKKNEIRAVVLTSLALQFILFFVAPLRKRSKNVFILSIIWLSYLLADYCASFGIGLMSRQEGSSSSQIVAFWAPFLLLHLGAPHTITAFSIEDNDLWRRHMLTLNFQLPLVLFVFYRNQIYTSGLLMIPAFFILAAGIFKYAGRVRSLYLASLPTVRRYTIPRFQVAQFLPDEEQSGADHERRRSSSIGKQAAAGAEAEAEDLNIVKRGFLYYRHFLRFIIDHTFIDIDEAILGCKQFLLEIDYKEAFKVMEVELNFIYDAMFTKMVFMQQQQISLLGCACRFACHAIIIIAAVIFILSSKHNVDPGDISITYALLGGAVVLDLLAFMNVIFSEWTIAMLQDMAPAAARKQHNNCVKRWILSMMTIERMINKINSVRRKISFRGWSREMGQYSLINYYYIKRRCTRVDNALDCIGMKGIIDSWQYTTTTQVKCYLMELVFKYIKKMAEEEHAQPPTEDAASSRRNRNRDIGERVVNTIFSELSGFHNQYELFVVSLHLATEIYYFSTDDCREEGDVKAEMCKNISEYLMYIICMEEKITSTVPGMRFRDTFLLEWTQFFLYADTELSTTPAAAASHLEYIKFILMPIWDFITHGKCISRKEGWNELQRRRTCSWLLRDYNTQSIVNLNINMIAAINLARKLRNTADDVENLNEINNGWEKEVWEVLIQLWMGLLCYTATHCRGDVQHLSRGGELLTFVRLLMAHFGLKGDFNELELPLFDSKNICIHL